MTRPQQVTRSLAVAHQVPVPRDLSQGFFWSASITAGYRYEDNNYGTTFSPGGEGDIAHESPRHATNGEDDFDLSRWPCVSIICPRDGIYAVSYCVKVDPWDPDDNWATGNASINLSIDNWSPSIWNTYTFDGRRDAADMQLTRVGIPILAGSQIRLYGENLTTNTAQFLTKHLEATYLGPMGSLYGMKTPPT